jgi:hypothetical protein
MMLLAILGVEEFQHRLKFFQECLKFIQGYLCQIWGFHGGDYEEWRLLGRYAVWFLKEPTFLRNVGSYKNHTA